MGASCVAETCGCMVAGLPASDATCYCGAEQEPVCKTGSIKLHRRYRKIILKFMCAQHATITWEHSVFPGLGLTSHAALDCNKNLQLRKNRRVPCKTSTSLQNIPAIPESDSVSLLLFNRPVDSPHTTDHRQMFGITASSLQPHFVSISRYWSNHHRDGARIIASLAFLWHTKKSFQCLKDVFTIRWIRSRIKQGWFLLFTVHHRTGANYQRILDFESL